MKINRAQRILIACGADHTVVLMGHERFRKSFSWTKKGPGRKHNKMTLSEVLARESK